MDHNLIIIQKHVMNYVNPQVLLFYSFVCLLPPSPLSSVFQIKPNCHVQLVEGNLVVVRKRTEV